MNVEPSHPSIVDDSRLLDESGLLDAANYCAAAGLTDRRDAARHYLMHGWRANLEPNPQFEGGFLYPYYRSAGLEGPPALTFLLLRAAGWPVYATRAQALEAAAVVSSSGLFDPVGYAARAGGLANLDPALHYVLVGEQLGLAPSDRFNPVYYHHCYPDVSKAAINGLAHYAANGRHEGRRCLSLSESLRFDRQRIDESRETILLFVHDGSRTGAPIIAYNIAQRLQQKYNVVAVLLDGGELVDDFRACCAAVVGPLSRSEWHAAEARQLVRRLCASYAVRFAIANSIETRMVFAALAQAHVPVVALVHEFASYTLPAGSMGRALDWATHIVFPASLVADSAHREHPTLRGRETHVLPQGFCPAPPARAVGDTSRQRSVLAELARQKTQDHTLVVFGCGTVHLRKGVDLFLACAAEVVRRAPARPVRFVWIGSGYLPKSDHSYSCYLADQIERSALTGTVEILDAIPDVAPAYAVADVFLLSSRLDPFPNVAIDAALHGIPVICFEGTTGIADFLARDTLTRQCVLPHLDVHGAAGLIARLADNEPERAEIGEATWRLAAATFDTDRYVRRLDELGADAVRLMRQRKQDFVTLREDPLFDAGVYVPPWQPIASRDEAINGFLARWQAVGPVTRPAANELFRRPCAGFHPQVYAYEHRDRYDVSAVNPLAHFIRSGKPEGTWCHEVIDPHQEAAGHVADGELEVALHAHFYYPELAADLVRRLGANRSRCDLLLTTDSRSKAALLEDVARDYDRGRVIVRLVPNHGRDLGPLLTLLADQVRDYDVIGHVHGKRSIAIDAAMGDWWREFLWQHLVGDACPTLDGILARFSRDPALGIVFPEDPHLCDWDGNGDIAASLAARMGLGPLPPFFDFPIGSMFWARTDALRPLFELHLDWHDYPPEPVPGDGTVLHAIERLLPFAARHAGYRYSTTHIPGWSR